MAHIDHFKRKDVFKIAKEVAREIKSKKYENEVDLSRSHLNYSLMGETTANGIANFVKNKIKEVVPDATKQMLGNMRPLCVACVHLPVELEDRSEEDKRRFFETTLEFFKDRYGDGDNIAYATVHRDETREHIHIGFVPVGVSRKTGKRTVSAASVVTKADLETLHPDYDAVIAKEFGMAGLVMNGRTEGKYTIKEYKARKDDTRQLQKRERMANVREKVADDKSRKAEQAQEEAKAREESVNQRKQQLSEHVIRVNNYVAQVKAKEKELREKEEYLKEKEEQLKEKEFDLERRETLLERSVSALRELANATSRFTQKFINALEGALKRKSEDDRQKVLEKGVEYTEKVVEPSEEVITQPEIDPATLLDGLEHPILDANDLISDLEVYQPSALER